MNRFDYIVAGAGCAGLSFLTRLLQTGKFSDKKILLVDKAPKRLTTAPGVLGKEPGFLKRSCIKAGTSYGFMPMTIPAYILSLLTATK